MAIHHIPTGHLLLMVISDIALVEMMSLILACAVGRACGSHRGGLYLVALIVPVLGPSLWYLRQLLRRRTALALVRTRGVSAPKVVGCGALVLAASVIAVSTWFDWVDGSVGSDLRSSWGFRAGWSPADLVVTAVATLGTSVLLLAAAAVALVMAVHGRVAVVVAAAGLIWLAVAVDELVLISAVDSVARGVSEVLGKHVDGGLSAGRGLDGPLAAGVLAVFGALALLAEPHPAAGRALIRGQSAAALPTYASQRSEQPPNAWDQPDPTSNAPSNDWW